MSTPRPRSLSLYSTLLQSEATATMAADIATLSKLLEASLDPRQNKQGAYKTPQHPAMAFLSCSKWQSFHVIRFGTLD